MPFINARLARQLDPDRMYTAEINGLNNLVAVLGDRGAWLCQMRDVVKAQIFGVALRKRLLLVKAVWNLMHVRVSALPSAADDRACLALLASLAQQGPHLDLPEKPAEIRPIRLPQFLGRLPSLLTHRRQDARVFAQEAIRGKDEEFTPRQSLVYARFVLQNRAALRDLVRQTSDCEAIFSLERGGALVADHLMALLRDNRPNYKVPKLTSREQQYSKSDHVDRFKQAVSAHVGVPDRQVTIGITETVVGGGSANKILETVNDLLIAHPNVRFKLLFERHTAHQNDDLDADFVSGLPAFDKAPSHSLFGESGTQAIALSKVKRVKQSRDPLTHKLLPPPTQVSLFIAKARYILGEDVGYQMAYDGASAAEPLVVFDQVRGQLKAVAIQPRGGHTAREMLLRLVLGAFDDVLGEHGLL